ncbi:MAG: glycosyltransferase family 4 protein [Thermoanaerobaculia bacterium]|nr:glycosyltransferase family 4 protein [Thermoanaerobaculia bacterium]MBP9823676.1 glycosyltransferase family 4 protein [Thermoanaerobaculia bacterium]
MPRADCAVAVSLFANDRGNSGIGRYLKSVVPRLVDAMPEATFHLFAARADQSVFAGCFERFDARVRWHLTSDFWNRPPPSLVWHAAWWDHAARRAGADALYLPAGNRRLAPFARLPSVAVVHDLSWLHMKGKYDPLRELYLRRLLPWMIRRSTRIIAISRSTESDLVQLAGCPPGRITRIANGFDATQFHPRDAAASRAQLQQAGVELPERFLLYVSRLEHPGKNHVTLLAAYRRLLDQRPDLAERLVFAGGRWNGAEAVDAAIADLGLEDRVRRLGFVADAHLPLLYATATALVFPSLFEGFGLPVIEAQACGLPVAGADASSIPEVMGGAGLLFDPLDPQAIATAITTLIDQPALRAELARRGLENARSYTWEATATATARLLRQVIDERRAESHRA